MALTQTDVSKLYVAIFNRASEGAGNKYWQTQGDLAEVANKMLATPDAQEYFGDSLNDDKAFVEWIYKNTFNKTYADDPKGIDHWVQNLKDGATRGEVIANIVTAATDPANAGDAQDQFMNRVAVSDYLANHFEGENLPEIMPDYKTKLGFDGDLAVTNHGQTVVDAEKLIDANYTDGKTITLTPDIDKGPDFAGTNASDTWIGESSTIGTADAISDPSVVDNDKFEITATGDIPAFTVVNVENIDVKFDTLGGNHVDAAGFSHGGDGTTITVSSDRFGFSGAATVDNLGSNKAVAGENITDLTVNGITNGTVDAGKAKTVNATTRTGTENLNLIVNGDVAVTGLDTTGDLNIEATADSVVDVTDAGFNNSEIKGDADVTIKSDSDEVDGETIKNSGTGTVTLELTDTASSNDTADAGVAGVNDVDMRKMDVSKAILDVAYNQELIINKDLEVTAKKAGNNAIFSAPDNAGLGGSNAVELTVNLTQKADGTDAYAMFDIGQTNINAEKGGTIDRIFDPLGSVKLNAGDDTVVTNAILRNPITLDGYALEIDGASAGKVTLASIDAQAIIANEFTKDLNITESDDGAENNIAIIGSQAKNSVTLKTTTATASVKTQDDDDTISADSITTGKLTVDTAGGKDTVTATGMETSNATFDLGAGDDSLTIKNAADGEATVNAGDGKDSVLVLDGTAGKMTINGDAGDDIVDLQAKIETDDDGNKINVGGGKLASDADVTVNGGDGDDTIKINETSGDSPTITIDGGAGSDIVEVTKDADFTGSTLSMSNIETLKIDTTATFSDDQLNDQTFEVASGTNATDILTVKLDDSKATDTPNTTNLSDLKFSTASSGRVEYTKIDATASKSDDTIKGAHHTANVIDLGEASGKETVQLFADGVGTNLINIQPGSPQPDLKDTDLTGIDLTKVTFDIAVIDNFETADDSLILGPAATATNYTEVGIDFKETSAPKAGVVDFFVAALEQANEDMAKDHDLVYEYVYDNGENPNDPDYAFLLWDSDSNHVVDAAILLTGVESDNDGSGFAASDIVAAS